MLVAGHKRRDLTKGHAPAAYGLNLGRYIHDTFSAALHISAATYKFSLL